MTHRLWCVTEGSVLHIGQFNVSQFFQRKQNRASCVSVFPSRTSKRRIYFYFRTHPSLIFLSIFFNRFIPTFLNQKILSFSIFDKFSKSLISVVSFCHNRVQRRKFFFSLDDVRRWRRALGERVNSYHKIKKIETLKPTEMDVVLTQFDF